MEDNAKCFIKIKRGFYEEITYKELNKRRNEDDTYKDEKSESLDEKADINDESLSSDEDE